MSDTKYGAVGVIRIDGEAPEATGEAWHNGWVLRSRWRDRAGRLEPVHVEIEDGRSSRVIRADGVRSLPIGEMLAATRRAIDNTASMSRTVGESTSDDQLATRSAEYEARGPQRGQALTEGELTDVAEVYRLAWSEGRPVNEAVREAFSLSQGGAAKRIMRARAAGLLEGVGPS